jgi:hypothetical protein
MGVPLHSCHGAKYLGQAVDRDHHDVVLNAFDALRADKAHDANGAVACPSLPAP